MNFAEMSRHLDELYNNMAVEELRDRLTNAGLIVFDGQFGFINLEENTFWLEPVQYSTKGAIQTKAEWELGDNYSRKVA